MITNFWWGQREGERKIQWCACDTLARPKDQTGRWGQEVRERKKQWHACGTLARPKDQAGHGFKELQIQNVVLLAKMA